jgi:tetratricopeptide (TPR) repeat protein/transcriptional regulator with XRE-family HTH domain
MAVAEQAALSFAALLRQLRQEARLTQEELAAAAGLAVRSVSDLERGVHPTARKDTAGLLADALNMTGPARELFVAAARGRAPAADVLAAWNGAPRGVFAAAATRTLPRDAVGFAGRGAELAQLLGAAAGAAGEGGLVSIHAIGGMAGVGKTTLAVHAAHQLAGHFPDGQFFLPLHAHTPGQRPVDPADALASLLLTAGMAAQQIPPGLDARSGLWRDFVAGNKILLLLDDAAGHEQVRPLLPGTAGSLVLITSRRRLTALEDAAVISLDTLPSGEAAALLARLAGRQELGSPTGPAAQITRLCGYLPLAIGMLARQLRHHPARTAAGLAADLASASDRLALMRAEDLSVAAAFDLSYAGLTPAQQRLFRRLGLVPGPSLDAYAAAALDGTSLDTARRRLDELYDQHLLAEPAPGRYQLHDLLREHARALAADDPAESGAAEDRLLDYYAHAAAAADDHVPAWTTVHGRPPPGDRPACAPGFATFEQAAAWLDTERPNLHAAVGRAAARGTPRHAVAIAAAMGEVLIIHGHWDQAATLHRTALAAARQAGDRAGEARALDDLGLLQGLTGNYAAAGASHRQALALYRELGDRPGEACLLSHLGFVYAATGDFRAATARMRQALAVARTAGDRLGEAVALNYLGYAQHLAGDSAAAAANLSCALDLYRGLGSRQGEALALSHLAAVQRETGDYPTAAASLRQALTSARSLGIRVFQAWALDELGAVQRETGDYPAAAASLHLAVELHRDLGSRPGQAEALNGLGELATRTSDSRQAREYHTQALAIARDLGIPLEEARALEGIGHAYLNDGNPGAAASHLQHALTIYQRIGAARARGVQDTLRHRIGPHQPHSNERRRQKG